MLSIIVAIANNMAIGNNNQLLCHISDDLKRFKALTSGHPVIMGRKTFDSLPKKPLPNRRNIVLTRDPNFNHLGIEVVSSVEQALSILPAETETFIIGGATVYEQFLPYVEKLYVTWIHKDFVADTFFPEIDKRQFRLVSETTPMVNQSDGILFSYAEFVKDTTMS